MTKTLTDPKPDTPSEAISDGLYINGIGKSFTKSEPVLHDIDLHVEPGEMVSLIGASGTGKSTLLRIIAGLEQADAGRIMYAGKPLSAGQVGFVFQRPILYPHRSVRDNILFPTRLRGYRQKVDEQYYNELVDRLKISELQDRKPQELSGGQAQRVGIARALIRRAPVVLFDEPLASVDEELSASIRADILRLHREYKFTGLYVTHDQNEALQVGQRVAVIEAGHLVQVEAPERLLANPHTHRVASLTSSPALNKLTLHNPKGLPEGSALYVRATALYRAANTGAAPWVTEQRLRVQVLATVPQVGGVLYHMLVLSEAAIRVDFANERQGKLLTVFPGQEIKYFEPDGRWATALETEDEAVLGVSASRCFIFDGEGKRVYE